MSNHLFSEQNRDIFTRLKDSPSKAEEHANLKLKAWQKRLGLGEQRDALAQFRNAEQKSELYKLKQPVSLRKSCTWIKRSMYLHNSAPMKAISERCTPIKG